MDFCGKEVYVRESKYSPGSSGLINNTTSNRPRKKKSRQDIKLLQFLSHVLNAIKERFKSTLMYCAYSDISLSINILNGSPDIASDLVANVYLKCSGRVITDNIS